MQMFSSRWARQVRKTWACNHKIKTGNQVLFRIHFKGFGIIKTQPALAMLLKMLAMKISTYVVSQPDKLNVLLFFVF